MKKLQSTFIFENPTTPYECHASTVLKLSEGNFLAAWFAGSKEGNEDVAIWVARCINGIWEKASIVSGEQNIPHWNPVLMQNRDGSVTLFYKIGHQIPHWETMVMHSHDQGEHWSEAKKLVPEDKDGGRGPVKNKALRLPSGRILAPCSTEQGRWLCFCDISEDEGQTYRKIPIPAADDADMIQPSFWEGTDGRIHALMRTNKGSIYHSTSADQGESWSPATPTDIPNNNSGLDCVKAKDGKVYLVCNPIAKNWGARSPLSLLVSADDGVHFSKVMDLEDTAGEYSYPAMIADGNQLYITYTYNRKGIRFLALEIE